MNMREIIDQVNAEVDDVIDDSLFTGWVHSAQVNIAKAYGKITKWELNATKDVEDALPAAYLKTSQIFDSDGNRVLEYTITADGNIVFPESDKYEIHYHEIPDSPPASTDALFDAWVPDVHAIFHPAIVLWCKAEYWDYESSADNEESAFSNKFRQRFYHERDEGAKLLRDRENSPLLIPQGEDWLY